MALEGSAPGTRRPGIGLRGPSGPGGIGASLSLVYASVIIAALGDGPRHQRRGKKAVAPRAFQACLFFPLTETLE